MAEPPPLAQFIDQPTIDALIAQARREDLGPDAVDVTSEICIDPAAQGQATFVARRPGILAGGVLIEHVARAYDPTVQVDLLIADGSPIKPGSAIAAMTGPLRRIVGIERVALNIVSYLSGIATLTRRFADAARGTKAAICDTRKTLPHWRGLSKYAVVCGGGSSHRMGLHDAMLIKDNHIAALPTEQLRDKVLQWCATAHERFARLKFVELEVDSLAQLDALGQGAAGVDMVLLDNFSLSDMRRAVAWRDGFAPGVLLEASGGVHLDAVKAIAATGVDRISIGALTHSAPSLDIGLDIDM